MQRHVLLLLVLVSLTETAAIAQFPFQPFRSGPDSADAIDIVRRYYAVPDSQYLDTSQIESLVAGELVTRTIAGLGRPIRPSRSFRWTIDRAAALANSGDSAAIVVVPTVTDSIPRFGPVTVDMIYYLRRTDRGWRIVDFHRQLLVEKSIVQLKQLDTAQSYPASLKPLIVREVSALLLSNQQLRSHFSSSRRSFDALIQELHGERNIRRLARMDRKAEQINNVSIIWMNSAQEIPKEAIAEYERGLTAGELKEFRKALAQQAKLRKAGDDSVASVARRLRINRNGLGAVLNRMHELRLVFVNRDVPWNDAIQCTVAGVAGHSLGYIYSPEGQLPKVSPDEYFYLEELEGGWWIFRAR